jgi:hypothetical protein
MRHSNTEWKVELAISGPISVKTRLTLSVEKGHNLPFWTTVDLKNSPHGIIAEVNARAETDNEANDAAVFFIGQMLDLMCLRLNSPLYVSLFGAQFRPINTNVKRIIDEEKWKEAFRLGREYGIARPVFSRALSWYRKGLTSEDPIDQLIAYWSCLEGIGAQFARRNDRTRNGAINQICDCFDQLWEGTANWKVIPNEAQRINQYHRFRNGISHGFMPVYPDSLRQIAEQLPVLRALVHAFLSDWEAKHTTGEPERINGE